MGILKGHIPLLTGLDTGLILVKKYDSNSWIPIVTMGGFALVNDDKITVLVNEAELGSEVNAENAQSNLLSAKMALESITDEKKKIEVLSQFKKARARVQALEQVKTL
jgi:F-type H+-transporting ATPase subunit epsilon